MTIEEYARKHPDIVGPRLGEMCTLKAGDPDKGDSVRGRAHANGFLIEAGGKIFVAHLAFGQSDEEAAGGGTS